MYLREAVGGKLISNIETSETRYYSMDDLPILAEEKYSKDQILMCFEANESDDWAVLFD